MATFTLPADPSDGQIAPASWGDDVRAALNFLANPPACRVYHSSAQSIAHNTAVILAFNQERFDTDTMHDTATNNSRITIKTAGLYKLSANLSWASAAGNSTRLVRFLLNGVTSIFENQLDGVGGTQTMLLETLYKLAVNDYVQVQVYHFQGAAVNVSVAGNFSPEFSAVWVGLG